MNYAIVTHRDVRFDTDTLNYVADMLRECQYQGGANFVVPSKWLQPPATRYVAQVFGMPVFAFEHCPRNQVYIIQMKGEGANEADTD